jgi:hypothetical protein
MHALRFVGACAVLAMGATAWGTGVSASIDGVFTARDASAIVPGGMSFNGPVGNGATQLTNQFGGLTNPYVNYQLSSQITTSSIDFYNNVTASGAGDIVSGSASNQLNVTFTNDGLAPVVPVLNSTITPGGFGIYTMDPTKNPTFSSGKVLIGDINQSPEYDPTANTFQGWSPVDSIQPIASASFMFSIASDGVVLASFNGSLTLNPNPADPAAPIVAVSLTGLGPTLNNFRLVTEPGSEDAVGYQWDATDISIALGGPLAVGASRTLTYSTVVTAVNSATFNASSPCFGMCDLVEFAGFGDPIGKGGPGSAIVPFGPSAPAGGPGPVTGLTFFGYSLGLPTFDTTTGNLSVPVATDNPLPSLPLTYTPAIVPEPSAWVLMLTGLGLVGYARRRRLAA